MSKLRAVQIVIERAVAAGAGAYVCLTNVHTTVESRRSEELRTAVDDALLSVPDGMPLTWLLRRRGHSQTEKVTGIEYIPLVASAGLDRGLRHYFYGGRPGVAARVGAHLQKLVPGVHVVGTVSPPYFHGPEPHGIDQLQADVARTRPHILWVGLGAPKQELWMAKMASRLNVPVMIGVGAAFDYLAGVKPAAPRLLRHIGLEWLFRLAVEPSRLWRRYLVGNSTFLWLLAREQLRRSHSHRGS